MPVIKFGMDGWVVIYRGMALLIIGQGINRLLVGERACRAAANHRVHIARRLIAGKAKIHSYHNIFAVNIANGVVVYGAAGNNSRIGSGRAGGPGGTVPKRPGGWATFGKAGYVHI